MNIQIHISAILKLLKCSVMLDFVLEVWMHMYYSYFGTFSVYTISLFIIVFIFISLIGENPMVHITAVTVFQTSQEFPLWMTTVFSLYLSRISKYTTIIHMIYLMILHLQGRSDWFVIII